MTGRTLFYMPHCGKALYNNLLWANWTPELLTNLLIIGNSFQHVCDRYDLLLVSLGVNCVLFVSHLY